MALTLISGIRKLITKLPIMLHTLHTCDEEASMMDGPMCAFAHGRLDPRSVRLIYVHIDQHPSTFIDTSDADGKIRS